MPVTLTTFPPPPTALFTSGIPNSVVDGVVDEVAFYSGTKPDSLASNNYSAGL